MNKEPESSVVQLPDPDHLDPTGAAAARWAIKLDGGHLSREDRDALTAWLREDTSHVVALRRWCDEWSAADEVLNMIAKLALSPANAPRRMKRFGLRAGFAAASLAAALTFFAAVQDRVPIFGRDVSVYSTAVGAQKTVQLADGSVLKLNTHSVVEVELLEKERIVTVLDGEVFFDVSHNEQWPFYVNVRGNVIKVVGTAFAVRAIGDQISVTVTEGLVELSEKARSAAENSTNNVLKLKPNQKAVIQSDSSAPEIDVMDNDQLERELSWQYGFFSFENEPLGNVIKEVSRYTDIKLVISDPTIREIRVRGRYEVGAIDSLLESLELSFGVRVTRLESGVVYLSRQ